MVAHYRWGETSPIHGPLKAASAVDIPDMVFIDTADGNTVKAAAAFAWTTDLPTTQTAFALKFAGCAGQRYDGVNAQAYGIKDGMLRVDTGGVFEFDCVSTSFKVGDLVGPAKDTGNNLMNQTVALVATAALAIGRVVKPTTSSTKVMVEIDPIFGRVAT